MNDSIAKPVTKAPKFPTGEVLTTPGVQEVCNIAYMMQCLHRHMTGDWGRVCPEDAETNNDALRHGGRLFSSYPIDPKKRCKGFGKNTLWIITEADRSVTTFLLPNEY